MPHSIRSELSTTSPPPGRSRESRNKDTALYHAHILQQRKDVEALILSSTETLLELPSSTDSDRARPYSRDISLVKNLLQPFQPSDYDSLIEERNINKQCGYVFCPKPNRQENTKARYRILHSKGRASDNVKFVERRTLERWCSDECGKRALYIKVQLSEEPAWTRTASPLRDILFLEDEHNHEKHPDDNHTLMEQVEFLDAGFEEDVLAARMKALAVERGDEKAPSRSDRLKEIDVLENRNPNGKISAPEQGASSGRSSGTIEGYTPRFSVKKSRELVPDSDEDEDMMPTI
ncbi:Rtr1/RPAP2 family-domain-containing protein [Usnea florida]